MKLNSDFPENNYTLRISTTSSCNLNCIYCNPKRLTDRKLDMTNQEILGIIKAGVATGIRKVSWTGGEPTIRPNFIKLIEKAKKLGIRKQGITTNGVIFFKIADKLKKAGLTKVNFSLDTLDRDEYKRICKLDALRLVIKSIKKALELYPQVKINCVITKSNFHVIDKFINFSEKYDGRIIIRFLEIVPCGQMYDNDPEIFKNNFVPLTKIKKQLEKHGRLTVVKIDGDVPKSIYYRIEGLKGVYGINPNFSVDFYCDKLKCPKIRVNPYGLVTNCTINLQFVRNFRGKTTKEKIRLMKEIVKEKAERNYRGFRHKQRFYDFWRFGINPPYIKKRFKLTA